MKVFLKTIGCKLNQFETDAIAEDLKNKGFEIADSIYESDIVIVNTCSVTAKADKKSEAILKKAKSQNKTVIATGCYATTDGERLKRLNYTDLVVENEHKFDIANIISKFSNENNKRNNDTFPFVCSFERTRAFLKIQDGCNKFCSYCKIPFARGRSVSCEPERLISFVEELVRKGYKEIVLTGVNISDYNYRGYKLLQLVKDMLSISGEYRVRLSSLQPDEFDPGFIDLLGNEKFAPHFHLSLQSGSNNVLKRMNRNYTREFFLSIVKEIRRVKSDCGLSTDIIVGFPEESADEFEETLETIEEAEFSRLHIFPYSRRPHTKAYTLPDLPLKLKRERERIINNLFKEVASRFVTRELINKPQKVLVEEEKNGEFTGYTPGYIRMKTRRNLALNEFHIITPGDFRIIQSAIELIE